MRQSLARVGAAVMVMILLGCANEADRFKKARPKTTAASGVVTFDGKPLAGAMIVLAPDGEVGTAASAVSGGSGQFELSAFPPDKGAVPGKYKVTVAKKIPGSGGTSGVAAHDAPEPPEPPKSAIPEKYASVETSGLTLEIPASGSKSLELVLKP